MSDSYLKLPNDTKLYEPKEYCKLNDGTNGFILVAIYTRKAGSVDGKDLIVIERKAFTFYPGKARTVILAGQKYQLRNKKHFEIFRHNISLICDINKLVG